MKKLKKRLTLLAATSSVIVGALGFSVSAYATFFTSTNAAVDLCTSSVSDPQTNPFLSVSSASGSAFLQRTPFVGSCNTAPDTGVNVSGFASATAGLASGQLRALASISGFDALDPVIADAGAFAEIFDVITIHTTGNSGIPVLVDFRGALNGAATGFGGGGLTMRQGINPFSPLGSIQTICVDSGGPSASPGCSHGSLSAILDDTFFIVPEHPFFFDALLNVGATNNGFVDAFHTATISIVLPAGYSFTSESGIFLTEPVSPEPVPEPASLALVGLGLAGLAASHRRKRVA